MKVKEMGNTRTSTIVSFPSEGKNFQNSPTLSLRYLLFFSIGQSMNQSFLVTGSDK
jgi:hypothetical protein